MSLTGPSITAPNATGNLLGFVKQQLPGGRHHKLMFRAVQAQARYWYLSPRLKEIWESR